MRQSKKKRAHRAKRKEIDTMKPVYNDHLMGYFSAFWKADIVLSARVNWYLRSSLKHITEYITGNRFYYRGGRYRQVSLYIETVITHVDLQMN